MDSLSSHIPLEALITNSVLRHLRIRFGSVRTVRGDGWSLFFFSSIDDDALLTEMQRLVTSIARDVVNRTVFRIQGSEAEVDCNDLVKDTLSFSKLLSTVTSSLDLSSEALPNTPAIRFMIEMLYEDIVSKLPPSLQLVGSFPKLLSAGTSRLDVVMKQKLCITAYANTNEIVFPKYEGLRASKAEPREDQGETPTSSESTTSGCKLWIHTRGLAHAFSSYAISTLENELPLQWRNKSFTIMESLEALKLVHYQLRRFWNESSRNDRQRMNAISLLAIVSGDLREYIKSEMFLYSADWRACWRMDMEQLTAAQKLCREWQYIMSSLLSGEWKDWKADDNFDDNSFDAFLTRLNDVVRIRQLLQITTTLKEATPDGMLPETIFDNVDGFKDLSPATNSSWSRCVAVFDKELSFLEPRLKSGLKKLLSATSASGDSQARLFLSYSTLIQLSDVKKGLDQEIARLFEFFHHEVEQSRSRFENNSRRCTTDLQRIRACRSCQTECAAVPACAKKIFGDDPHLSKLVSAVATIIESCKQMEKTAVDQWRASIETQSQKIIEVDQAVVINTVGTFPNIFLQCTVASSVSQFLKEARNFQIYSHEDLSSEASRNAVDACEKLWTAAMNMQQSVSNFNTVIRQAIPCTREMLKPSVARVMSQVFYTEGESLVIAVVNHQELKGLHLRFQNSVESLSTENRHIRRFHSEFLTQVMSLHNVDLTKHMDQWRSVVDSMRGNYDEFIFQHRFENCTAWRRHLDSQIYKALEHQYRKGLEMLHQNMEAFNVDLVFRQGSIQMKPSFEAVREAYYVKVREFISVPLRFRGLQAKRETSGGKYEVYPTMILTNSEPIVTVHTKSIELFSKLQQLRKALRSHIIIGLCGVNNSPDLDSIVEEWLKASNNFSGGFQLIQDRLGKLRKMDDIRKVDCFQVNIVPVKSSIEEQLRRLEEALLNEMRKHIQSTLTEIDTFVFNASNVVERQPATMDEVGQANQAYQEYVSQLGTYETRFKEIDEMNRELRLQCGTSIEFGPTTARLDHLKDAMASHTKVIDSAVAKMRVSLDGLIQKFLKDVQRFSSNWSKQKNQLLTAFKESNKGQVNVLITALKDQMNDLADLRKEATELEAKCKYFSVPKPNFNALKSTGKDVERSANMWKFYDSFFEALDELKKEDWLTFRAHTYEFTDFCKEWRSKATESSSKENVVTEYLMDLMSKWDDFTPLLRFCRGEGWMTEHWNELFRVIGVPKGTTSTDLTFGDILSRYEAVIEKQSEIKQLHARAEGEIQLREALQDLRVWALEAVFTLVPSTDAAVLLISDWKDVMTQVSENQSLVASLKDSPFYHHFADEATGWENKLVAISECLVLLNSIQRKWTYLEPIFARGALPQEQARFQRVNKEFVAILRDIDADRRIMSLLTQSDFNDKLKGMLEQIERCQKALQEFLEVKRNKFSRFYFISDDDLLEILGHSQNPTVIQSHLKKLFMGIHSVSFNNESSAITHMLSSDGESVALDAPVSITDKNVEDWLVRLDDGMKATIKEAIIRCTAEKSRMTDSVIRKYPSQALQIAESIAFASQVEKAIPQNGIQSLLTTYQEKLQSLTSFDGDVSAVELLKVKALILDTIHNIEILQLLCMKRVKHVEEWWWQKQLRYEFNTRSMSCIVKMIDSTFDYTYEYQGNAAKLVHTPLTDKCYLVLTKGMKLGFGGNPYGPAGTGKTESVKALGSALGRQVLVFNCDEGIDFKSMGRIFTGIVKCGAWGCFDEFNRLKIDQLSAISQMIQAIQESLKRQDPTCPLLGQEVELNLNSGIFVTLNPAGKGYGGRTKLPDNLKQLFREVVMTVPDTELIASTMLLSEGFTSAGPLAKKIVELYKLCSQLMSKQQHYDWGLRPLKAVLKLGGTLVQKWLKEHKKEPITEKIESELILQSLTINTVSKLTFDDTRLFDGLVQDIFPGVDVHEVAYKELEEAIASAVKSLGLQLLPSQVKKVLQAYESMNQRMGVVLVGPSGSGKSTLIRILQKALETLGKHVPTHTINPKAMSRQQLLGHMDPDTREWYDGVLTVAARDAARQPSTTRPWIICDGDIDPEWIESLNSVLDDNKLLTMPNGVRIQFGLNVNFIFETHSLEFASPATVSRMGVLYFSDKDVYLEATVESFMNRQREETRKLLSPLIMKYAFNAINDVFKSDKLSVPTTRAGLLTNCLSQVMDCENEVDFVYSLVRALTCCLTADGGIAAAKQLFQATGQRPISDSRPLDTYWCKKNKKLLEHKADLKIDLRVDSFSVDHVPVVQTVEVHRLDAVLSPLLSEKTKSCTPFLIVGPQGCGKNIVLQHVLTLKGMRSTVISCGAQTNSLQLIQKLENSCNLFSTSSGRVLRPRDGDRLVLVLRNIHLPKPDKYGTVELHAFIHQLIAYHGFYNKELEWIDIERIQIVGTMSDQLSPGRYPVASRLLAIMNIVTVGYPSRSSLTQIYSTIWSELLRQTSIGGGKTYENGLELAQFMINVYDKVRKRFEGEQYAHFHFCPRHLTQWTASVLQYKIDVNVTLPAILAYEANRIFADCLPTAEDRKRAEKIFADQLASIGYSVPKEENQSAMFTSWFTEAESSSKGTLAKRPYDDILTEFISGLLRFSREYKELHIPKIPETLVWICRIDRVLSRTEGHLIVVGRPGVGRRDAVLISAYMKRLESVSLHITHDYNLKQFRMELRGYVQKAVVQNVRIVLTVEDHHIIHEAFLEILNSLVSSGDVSSLFAPEEVEAMLSSLREEVASEGFVGTTAGFFVDRLRRNLRVAFIMDSEHELFLIRLQSNPGLLSKCELLWIGGWSSDTAKSICKDRMKDQIKKLSLQPAYKDFSLYREILQIHHNIGNATPKDLETFMDTYSKIVTEKAKSSSHQAQRLENGLSKLNEAEKSVDLIKTDVVKKKQAAEVMQAEADQALNEIQKKMEESQEQRDQAAELQEQLKEEHDDIIVKRQKSEEELGGIKPMMEAARDAVSSIRSETLSEVRSLKSPPEPIRDVLEGVLALLGVTDTSWQSMRKFLGERGVKERILEFNVEEVTPGIRATVSKLLQQKSTSFKPEVIQRASVAAAPMAEWVIAMVKYSTIMDRIAPLSRQLQQLESNQHEGEEKLQNLRKKLEKIDRHVEGLLEDFSKKCKETEKLKGRLEKAEGELKKAEDLLSKLSEEKSRWAKEVRLIKEINSTTPKQALVAAAFMTYLGKEPEEVRDRLVKLWCARFSLEPVKLPLFLRSEGELLQFKAEGLPGDDLSMENAAIVLECLRTPLIVDPANRAIDWVRNHYISQKVVVEVTSLHDERFTHTLELAIRFGKTLFITEVDDVIPMLYPILRCDLSSAGAKRTVQVGNKSVDWQDTFKIVLFTRDTGLSLSPEAAALVQEVNFSVTSFGLESQLLGVTIQHEKPEIEEQKMQLLEKEEKLKIEINLLESRLLQELAESSGDLLENTHLITSLNEIKEQSKSIQNALKQSHKLQKELDAKRDVYRPFARCGSLLFFVVKELSNVNRMYQFGLNDFLAMFTKTLEMYDGPEIVEVKIPALEERFAQLCFHHVSVGLMKRDRLAFGLNLVRRVGGDRFPAELWHSFVGVSADLSVPAEDISLPSWAPPSGKSKLSLLGCCAAGKALIQKWALNDATFWGGFMSHPNPETLKSPERAFTSMERLLAINIFRPDRLSACSLGVILSELKIHDLVPTIPLEDRISMGEAQVPILLITSSGADPSMEVQTIADQVVGRERFVQIALGGGQTDEALQMVRRGAAKGDWVFLKNIHLVLSWSAVLEKELCTMSSPHPDFRLIITTEQHEMFPTVLLRIATKISVEVPPGVKQNLLRTYTTWDRAFLESQTEQCAQMLFGLAWFHAVVFERRSFTPQGWGQYYDFSNADIKAATDVIVTLSQRKQIDWVTVVEVLQQCVYGGRIENTCDDAVLSLLIETYFNDQVLMKSSHPLFGSFCVPATNNHDSVIAEIKANVPDVDAPSMIHLPANADRAVLESAAADMCDSLRGFVTMSQSEKSSVHNWCPLLAASLELWKSEGLAGSVAALHLSNSKSPDPMEIFFVSEINSIISVVDELSTFFAHLKSMAEGTLIPSASLIEAATEISGGRIPKQFLERMDGPCDTKQWLALLKRKYTSTVAWSKQLMSSAFVYDLSALLRPETFFNALRQHTARQTRVPLVDLVLVASVGTNPITESLQVSVAIKSSSLCLQGAVMARDGSLEDVASTTPSSLPLSVNILAGWIQKDKLHSKRSGFLTLPVYNSLKRQKKILELSVPCKDAKKEIQTSLGGVAVYIVTES